MTKQKDNKKKYTIKQGPEPTYIVVDPERTYSMQNLYNIDKKIFKAVVRDVTDILGNMIDHGCMFYDPNSEDYTECSIDYVNTLDSIVTLALVVFENGDISAICDEKCEFFSDRDLRNRWTQSLYRVKPVTIILGNGDIIRQPFITGDPIENAGKFKYRHTYIDNIYDNVMRYNYNNPDKLQIAKFIWTDPGHLNWDRK